jgi:hypothetical protein
MEKGLKNENIRAVYMPAGLFKLCEETRKKLGMSRSRFIQYCITRTLEQLSVLTAEVHKEEQQ